MSTLRQHAGQTTLLVLAGALGAIAAFGAARVLELRLAEESLLLYARHVLRVTELSASEAVAAIQFSHDGEGFCSDDELAAMRRFAYNAAFVKDLGRERDGMLYCTSTLGRLPHPLPMPTPVLSYFNTRQGAQVDIIPNQSLALAPGSSGFIAVMSGVTIVLNPALYARLSSATMRAAGMVRDSEHEAIVYAFGQPAPLSAAEVLRGKMLERDGVFYQPLCSDSYNVCVIGSEARADMFVGPRGYFVKFPATTFIFSTVGAVLGISIAGCILLFLHRQRSFERRLRRAVRTRQIMVAYQPVVDLATHAVVGAEALARWTDEAGEEISPDVFIPIAEEKGFIGVITRQILDRVIHEMGSLLMEGDFRVSVNLSGSDLGDPLFFAHLERALAASRVPARAIAFEITERTTALHSEGQEGIARLRAAGHSIFLDDFGTGYSSLSYLHDLHADGIKIDRSFTLTVGTEAVIASVVPQILEMALKLGLSIVVEGIETAEQAEYFRTAFAGAHGQGWLFGRPVAAHEFRAQLRMRSRSSAQGPFSKDPASFAGESEG
jgi:sensor c-di-GMP phosphodiesterase-like protein